MNAEVAALLLLLLPSVAGAEPFADRTRSYLEAKGYAVEATTLDTTYRQQPCRTQSISFKAVTADKRQRVEGRVCCNATVCVGPYFNASYTLVP